MKDGGKVLSSISLIIRNWAGIWGWMWGLLRCMGVEITGGDYTVVGAFN